MSKPVIILITVVAWAVGCAYDAYSHVTSNIALPGIDAYAATWRFQLSMFAIFRLPFWLVGLLAVVSLEVVRLKPTRRKLR
jgi:hypothetical protein